MRSIFHNGQDTACCVQSRMIKLSYKDQIVHYKVALWYFRLIGVQMTSLSRGKLNVQVNLILLTLYHVYRLIHGLIIIKLILQFMVMEEVPIEKKIMKNKIYLNQKRWFKIFLQSEKIKLKQKIICLLITRFLKTGRFMILKDFLSGPSILFQINRTKRLYFKIYIISQQQG